MNTRRIPLLCTYAVSCSAMIFVPIMAESANSDKLSWPSVTASSQSAAHDVDAFAGNTGMAGAEVNMRKEGRALYAPAVAGASAKLESLKLEDFTKDLSPGHAGKVVSGAARNVPRTSFNEGLDCIFVDDFQTFSDLDSEFCSAPEELMKQAYMSESSPPADLALPPVHSPQTRHPYKKIENQVLFRTDQNGNPVISGNLTNIRQGDAGDCYFLASLMAVAKSSPETIQALVRDNNDGTYTGRFYGLASKKFWGKVRGRGNFVARVNGDLPSKRKRLAFNWVETIDAKNVSWVAIIEKLWAAVNHNNYARINGFGDSGKNDRDVQNGLFAITGIVPIERKMESLTFEQVRWDLRHGAVVVGSSTKSGKVEPDHALAVLDVDETNRTVNLGDPDGPRPQLKFKKFTTTNINQYFFVPLAKNGSTADNN